MANLQALSPGVSWWYNWAPVPDNPAVAAAYASLGVEFVPMAWDLNDLPKLTEIPVDAAHLLGFNEPNFGNQANLTPEAAAAAWPQIDQSPRPRAEAPSRRANYCGSALQSNRPVRVARQVPRRLPRLQGRLHRHALVCVRQVGSHLVSGSIQEQVHEATLADGVRVPR